MPVLAEDRKHIGIAGPPMPPGGSGGDGREPGQPASSFPVSPAHMGMWILLTGVTMLFAGLTSAYIVLRGVPSWQNVALPPMLWWNTAVLILSSGTIELARRAAKSNGAVNLWLCTSAVLGMVFLGGQVIVWRQLVSAGVYVPSTLHSSFFYILTGLHGLHLVGGVIGMMYVVYLAMNRRLAARRYEPLKLCGLYWHFMDGVWIYLFLLLVMA